MRPRAAEVFSDWIAMFDTAVSNRLCTAPSVARALLTWSSASSTCLIASHALSVLATDKVLNPVTLVEAMAALVSPIPVVATLKPPKVTDAAVDVATSTALERKAIVYSPSVSFDR